MAILGEIGDAVAERIARRADPRRLSLDEDGAAVKWGGAKYGFTQFGAAGANESCQTKDFATVDRKAHILKDPMPGESLNPQHLILPPTDSLGKVIAPLPTNHLTDQEVAIDSPVHIVGADELAIFEDRDAIGNLEDLAQAVGDIKDRDSLCLQGADDCKELVNLA
jgi:hypothetical protein